MRPRLFPDDVTSESPAIGDRLLSTVEKFRRELGRGGIDDRSEQAEQLRHLDVRRRFDPRRHVDAHELVDAPPGQRALVRVSRGRGLDMAELFGEWSKVSSLARVEITAPVVEERLEQLGAGDFCRLGDEDRSCLCSVEFDESGGGAPDVRLPREVS